MIPKDYITEWRSRAPWVEDYQVEQDLIISRALVEIFSSPFLAERLAFRGGTAIYKLHVSPPRRYSEDIDLVQTRAEPIGSTMSALRAILDPWLGQPRWDQSEGRIKLIYRFTSEGEPAVPLRLKVEINSREHFSVFGIVRHRFEIGARWYSGVVEIPTYAFDELIGTKLRALYQRKKGRDLFDVDLAMTGHALDPARVVEAFGRYLEAGGHRITRSLFEQNLAEKRADPKFINDVRPLLARGDDWDSNAAFETVQTLLTHLPGEPWNPGE